MQKPILFLFGILITTFLALPLTVVSQGVGTVNVSGTITSSDDGQPMVGVHVIASPTRAVVTMEDGKYRITADEGATIIFSYLGYITAEFTLPEGVSDIVHDVVMEREPQTIQELVVVAYGVRKKGSIAGSVSSIQADKIKNTPTAAFDQAIQGQVPGLTVLSNSGEPSKGASLTIRGTNSINSGTSPLYIMDGVAISANDFNTINPSDIESLSVLKDAAATSIYGARAANGVIVITTKRGQLSDRPLITFRTQIGFSQATKNNWNLMNTAERIEYEKEVGLTEGKDYDALGKIDVNWFDEVFNKSAMLQNYELSVAGASDKTNYYVSGGYYNQDGTAPGSGFERYSFRTNVEQRAARWLKIGTNTMLTYQNIKQADDGEYTLDTPISAAQFMLPYWNPRRSNGSLASVNDGSWKGSGQNPLEWAKNNSRKYRKYKIISTLFAEARPIEGLTLRSQFNVDYSHVTARASSTPSYLPNQGEGSVSRNSSDGMTISVTNTANYVFSLENKHNFNFMLGQEGLDYHYESFGVSTKGQTNDNLLTLSNGTRALSWPENPADDYSYVSFFGRGEYNYANRYHTEFTVRTDGSSRFGKNNRWGVFGSVAMMWNMLNEDFMKDSPSWLSKAQIAVSTGTSGNSSIPNYAHLALVGGTDYLGNAGIAPSQPGNEDLGWEKLWTSNLAFHFGFWNRLDVDLEFYNKKTTSMLMSVPISYATSNGYGYKWDNVGGMVNRGVELNLTGSLITGENFSWTMYANASYNKNKITELYRGVTEYVMGTSSTKLVVGHSVGEFFVNRYAGVNPANGDALWYDKDGNLTTELNDNDKVMVGKSFMAPWAGGFGTTASWKGLSLSAQFSWVAGRWMMNNDRYFNESNGRFGDYNQSKKLLYDRWKKPGDITHIPRHGDYTEFDSRLLEDASFLRLKNLTLSYTLPSDVVKRVKFISGVNIYAQAQNLFTFTKFSGLDPENTSNIYRAQYPMARQFTFGLDIMF